MWEWDESEFSVLQYISNVRWGCVLSIAIYFRCEMRVSSLYCNIFQMWNEGVFSVLQYASDVRWEWVLCIAIYFRCVMKVCSLNWNIFQIWDESVFFVLQYILDVLWDEGIFIKLTELRWLTLLLTHCLSVLIPWCMTPPWRLRMRTPKASRAVIHQRIRNWPRSLTLACTHTH